MTNTTLDTLGELQRASRLAAWSAERMSTSLLCAQQYRSGRTAQPSVISESLSQVEETHVKTARANLADLLSYIEWIQREIEALGIERAQASGVAFDQQEANNAGEEE